MRWRLFLWMLLIFPARSFAQMQVADSLYLLLEKEKVDTNRVNIMCDIGFELRVKDPEKALAISGEALSLAKKNKYIDGQARAIGTMAIIFRIVGNFPRALEFNLQRLKLVEISNRPDRLASVLINIANVYVSLEDYPRALDYYHKADSVIERYNIEEDKHKVALNIGDVYDKLKMNDSAFSYFNKSLNIARRQKDTYLEGTSMTGLGNTYLKSGQDLLAMANFKSGSAYLEQAGDDDLLCEATLGLAILFSKLGQKDSAVWYARRSLVIAEKNGFLPRQLEAAKFLTTHFANNKKIDSAFRYISYVQAVNDTLNSKTRIRESQVLSSNEQLRQLEMAENLRIAKKERKQQLQLLFIAIFIPGFFLVTLLLSRIRLHVRVIKILGVLSLLILFEYLTLLLHPYVVELTNHTPVYEMLIFVSIAAILIPLHHRVENLLIKWLTKNRPLYAGNRLQIKKTRITKKTT